MAKDISSEPAQKMVDEEVAKVRAAMIERAKDSHQPAAKAVEALSGNGRRCESHVSRRPPPT
jgi:hypothetical protein